MKDSARFILIVCATVALVGIVKARSVTLTMTRPEDKTQRWDPPDAVRSYDTECPAGTVSADCAALRGAVLFQIVSALEEISSFYERGDEQLATLALDVREPEVKEAALRVLAGRHDRAAEPKVLAVLLGDGSWELHRLAASVLSSARDGNAAAVAAQWQGNHPDEIGVVRQPKLPALLWADAARPAPADVGFTAYAGASRYPPGESDRAIAFVTKDPVDRVVAFYARSTKAKALDPGAWEAWMNDHLSVYHPTPDPKAMAELQQRMQVKTDRLVKLAQEFARTQSKQLEEQIKKLQAEIDAEVKAFEASIPKAEERPGVLAVRIALPANASARILVEEKNRRAARIVCVYREDAIGATVIQLVWDPTVVVWKRP